MSMTSIGSLEELSREDVRSKLREGVSFTLDTATGPRPVILRSENIDTFIVAVTADTSGIKLSDLGALMQLVAGLNFNVLPADIPVTGELELVHLGLRLQPRTNNISGLDVDIELPRRFELLGDQFALERLGIAFSVTSPFGPRRTLYCRLYGTLEIGAGGDAVRLDAEAHIPSLEFEAELSGEDPQSIGPLLASIGLSDALPDLAGMNLTRLSLRLDRKQRSYAFASQLNGAWEIASGFGIEELRLDVAGGVGVSPSVGVGGAFDIAGAKLAVSAERSEDGRGWLLTGDTRIPQAISLGALIDRLTTLLGIGLPSFSSATSLTDLGFSYNTLLGDMSFYGRFNPLGNVRFERYSNKPILGRTVVASYHNPEGASLSLRDVVSGISEDLANMVPAALSVTVKDAVFVSVAPPSGGPSKTLFGVKLGAGLDLSKLPLVGSNFPADQPANLDYQLLFATAPFSANEVQAMVPLFGAQGMKLLPQALSRGQHFNVSLTLGGETRDLSVPVQLNDNGQINPPPPGTPPSDVTWVSLQKSFGPVQLGRVGVRYAQGVLWLLLDASLSLAVLRLGLMGLGVGVALNNDQGAAPQFMLQGIEVSAKMPPVFFAGALYVKSISPPAFYGQIIAQLTKFGFALLGGYEKVGDHDTFLAYGYLQVPIGGLPYLKIDGLAGGVGINRTLKLPSIELLDQHPFIGAVRSFLAGDGASNPLPVFGSSDDQSFFSNFMIAMEKYLPPAPDSYWGALGIAVSIAETIKGFALLALRVGETTSVSVMGMAVFTSPPVGPIRLVYVELNFSMQLDFTAGEIAVDAYIRPTSFAFSKQCRLEGGLAFRNWFKGPYAGQFVLSLGGYHPHFKRPEHYPSANRVGINWQISSVVELKGSGYLTITNAGIMGGFTIDLSGKWAGVSVWLKMDAHFLMEWHPFHYSISASVHVGVSYRIKVWFVDETISAHVGASLQIWGPELSGKLYVDLWLLKVPITFGANASKAPPRLSYQQFERAFLSPSGQSKKAHAFTKGTGAGESDVCRLAVGAGLLGSYSDGWVVNPELLVLTTESSIPSKSWSLNLNDEVVPPSGANNVNTDFGVGPCGISSSEFKQSQHRLTIQGPSKGGFKASAVRTNAPAALWKVDAKKNPMGDHSVVKDVISGFEIRVQPRPPAQTLTVEFLGAMHDDEIYELMPGHLFKEYQSGFPQETSVSDSIRSDTANNNRQRLFGAMAAHLSSDRTPDGNVSVGGLADHMFLDTPRMRLLGEEKL